MALAASATILYLMFMVQGRNPFAPLTLYVIFTVPAFLLRPAILLLGLDNHKQPHLINGSVDAAVLKAVIVFLVAQAVLLVAFLVVRWAWSQREPQLTRPIDGPRLKLAVTGLLVLSTVIVAVGIAAAGGIQAFSRGARGDLFAGLAPLVVIPQLALYYAVLNVVEGFKAGHISSGRWYLLGWAVLILMPMADRSALLTPVIAAGFVLHFTYKRLNWRQLGLAVAFLIIGAVIMGEARSAWFSESETSEEAPNPYRRFSDGLNLQKFDHFVVVVDDIGPHNQLEGESYTTGVLGIIPRSIWADKPESINTGHWYTDRYTPEKNSGQPISPLGEAWINFGWAGVILFGGLAGIALAAFSRLAGQASTSSAVAMLYYMLFMHVVPWGQFNSAVPRLLLLWLVPNVVILAFIKRRSMKWLTEGRSSSRQSREGLHE